MSRVLPRIYADFNGYRRGESLDWVELDTFGTLVDLHFQQLALADGLELMAWDQSDEEEDLEVTGRCRFNSEIRPYWFLEFPKGELNYVPRRHASVYPLLCFRCRHRIAEPPQPAAVEFCPVCNLPLDFPWSPPSGTNPRS